MREKLALDLMGVATIDRDACGRLLRVCIS